MTRQHPFDRVRKRDGRLVPFDAERITPAVFRAARETGMPDRDLAERATAFAVEDLATRFDGRPPGIEDIQDAVERALMGMGRPEVARSARLKGITIYRYGSKRDQVLSFLSDAGGEPAPPLKADAAYAGGCAAHACEF